ncbi:MAG: hypothetical protein PHC89_01700 [Candidatus Pacebacteria bacterium]|nr:hypothetical protein [Candidatus Paceibacterota bacterium]
MDRKSYLTVFWILRSKIFKEFKDGAVRYQKFLQQKVAPLIGENTVTLNGNTPKKIEKGHQTLTKNFLEKSKEVLILLKENGLSKEEMSSVTCDEIHFYPSMKKMIYIIEALEEIQEKNFQMKLGERINNIQWLTRLTEEITRDLDNALTVTTKKKREKAFY